MVFVQCWLGEDFVGLVQVGVECFFVFFFGEVIEDDFWWCFWVGGFEFYLVLVFGFVGVQVYLEIVVFEGVGIVVGDGFGQEVELNIWVFYIGVVVDVVVGFKLVGGVQVVFEEQLVGVDLGFCQWVQLVVQGDVLGVFLLYLDFQMVLQVLVDVGQIVYYFDVVFFKMFCWIDIGQYQQFG